ncbi:MAG TPA: TetR/AcrR family transcriptional regulator [Halanaerobiales bacterium]|nr:TetR/AcrR family transcriptional regulator [Halanaerobiales bacterium]
MPKIIDNIEEKIYNAAFELFTNKGYDSVNMKMVAKKTGIAVGTLYNYHQNKKQLYLDVFKNSWDDTYNKIDAILKEENRKDKLKSLINILYTDISKRRGFAQELIKSNELKELGMKFVEELKNELKGKIKEALTAYIKYKKANISEDKKARLVQLIFTEIIALNNEFSSEKEKNLVFIMELVNSTLE